MISGSILYCSNDTQTFHPLRLKAQKSKAELNSIEYKSIIVAPFPSSQQHPLLCTNSHSITHSITLGCSTLCRAFDYPSGSARTRVEVNICDITYRVSK